MRLDLASFYDDICYCSETANEYHMLNVCSHVISLLAKRDVFCKKNPHDPPWQIINVFCKKISEIFYHFFFFPSFLAKLACSSRKLLKTLPSF